MTYANTFLVTKAEQELMGTEGMPESTGVKKEVEKCEKLSGRLVFPIITWVHVRDKYIQMYT